MAPVIGQAELYPRADIEFDFEATIAFYIAQTRPVSRDERVNINFRVSIVVVFNL